MALSKRAKQQLLKGLGLPSAVREISDLIDEVENVETSDIVNGAITSDKLANSSVINSKMDDNLLKYIDVVVSSAEMLDLANNNVELLPAVNNKAYLVDSVYFYMDFQNDAYSLANPSEELEVKFDGGSVITSAPNTFVEASSENLYLAKPVSHEISHSSAVVANIANNPTLGDSDVIIRIYYKLIDYKLS
jgi:hypothetical protein